MIRAWRLPTLRNMVLVVLVALPGWLLPVHVPTVGAAEAPAAAVAPATLTIWNRPIVVLRAAVGPMTPAARAVNAARRIEAIPLDVRPEEITAAPLTVGSLHGIAVAVRDTLLFAILSEDIDPSGGDTLKSVSAQAVEQLQSVLRARLDQRRPAAVLRGIGLSLAATALLALALWLIGRAAERASHRFRVAEQHPYTVPLMGKELSPFMEAIRRTFARLTAWSLGLIAVYLWLTYVLYQFPYTAPLGARAGAYIVGLLTELAWRALGAVPGLFAVVVIFAATRFVVRAVNAFFRGIERGTIKINHFEPDTAMATRRVVSVLIWILTITVAYEYIPGSDTEAFKAIGVLAGLMVSLGSAGLMNQVMSGLAVMYARALRPGEFVNVGDVSGRVSELGLLSTKLITARQEEVTVPNAVLAATMVTNYSRRAGKDGAVVSTSATIGYDQPWRQVHALLLLAAGRTPGVRKEPAPWVLQTALSDFAVRYEVCAQLEEGFARSRVLSDLNAQIQDAFNEFGVQIMSPAFESQPADPVTVPRARWHAAPATTAETDAAVNRQPRRNGP